MYEVLTNESYQFILFIVLCFGAAVKLFQASGCLIGFGNLISKVASGPKKPLLLALLTNVIMFMDDYLNTLGYRHFSETRKFKKGLRTSKWGRLGTSAR